MRRLTALAAATALLGCGGGGRAAPPATAPAPARTAPPAAAAPLFYRPLVAQAYDIARYDSLSFESMGGGTPQASAKTGLFTVRFVNGQATVTLATLVAGAGTRISTAATDSARGARWEFRLGRTGPGPVSETGAAGLAGDQMGVLVRLLYPQLPNDGLKANSVWADSSRYQVHLDAFSATESAVRWSRASGGGTGIVVEATERLVREGTALQGGQTMSLSGTGERRLRYDFAPGGWVTGLIVRDSLDLRVRVAGGNTAIPVRWRTTLTASLRGPSPR